MTILELKNISKTFGSFKANSKISLTIKTGEVHAILGENGAGKSTLMKIIFGLYQPDSGGEIFLKSQKVQIKSPRFAISKGIGMVHQHFMLIKPFTVLQNIILGVEPKNKFGIIDYKKAREEVIALSKAYHFQIDLDQKIENISVGMQQRVEIIKTLYRNAEIIILDEPTAVLTPQEVIDFYNIIKNLKSLGKTILIITHKLHEIKEIADRCSIIRKGEYIETVDVNQVSEEELASKMVGREVSLKSKKSPLEIGECIFKIEKIKSQNDKNLMALNDFSLTLNTHEIYGLSGIDGNGQNELVECLMGLRKVDSGNILLNGKNLTNLSPKEVYTSKLSLIPPDRKKTGLVLDFKVKENFVLQNISKKPFSNYGIILNSEIEKFAHKLMERFDIRPRNIELLAENLSGGNQQKIILAREIESNPDLLVCFQPTRGLDVGAIEYIHNELIKLRDNGKTILLISYELDEIINLSDRIGVICEGKLVHEFSNDQIMNLTNLKESIGLHMASGSSNENK
jgi:simple sugar transport system ATP-binding protein